MNDEMSELKLTIRRLEDNILSVYRRESEYQTSIKNELNQFSSKLKALENTNAQLNEIILEMKEKQNQASADSQLIMSTQAGHFSEAYEKQQSLIHRIQRQQKNDYKKQAAFEIAVSNKMDGFCEKISVFENVFIPNELAKIEASVHEIVEKAMHNSLSSVQISFTSTKASSKKRKFSFIQSESSPITTSPSVPFALLPTRVDPNLISFDAESHTYFYDGTPCQAVSHFKKGFLSKPFEPDSVIDEFYPKWENNKKSEYFGLKKDEIKQKWEEKRDNGTLLHNLIESFAKNKYFQTDPITCRSTYPPEFQQVTVVTVTVVVRFFI